MPNYAKVVDGEVVNIIVADPDYFDGFVDSSPGLWVPAVGNVGIGYFHNTADNTFTAPNPFLAQIRLLEEPLTDDMKRLNRQVALSYTVDLACREPAASSLTRAQVHDVLMATKPAYKRLWDMEQKVIELRKNL